MQMVSPSDGTGPGVSAWSRFLGISLRPWSGFAPSSLLLRGVIQVALFGFVLSLLMPYSLNKTIPGMPAEMTASLRGGAVLLMIVFALAFVRGAAQLVVGAVDLVPRRTVTGTVVSLQERKTGDFLPVLAQQAIFARNNHGTDRRQPRTEVVLDTPSGTQQWTVRNARVRRELLPGRHVQLVVSPIVGYVAQAHSVPPHAY